MPTTNHIEGDKFYFGEKEFTNLIWVLIRAYKFHNKNNEPLAIVIPDIKEVNGVKIEYLGGDNARAKPRDSKPSK